MANGQLRGLICQLRRQSGCTLSDAQLLDEFVTRRDEASFEVLVWRHGSMVLSVCQRVLHDSHEAEDAFQATFLVFARKAGSISKREAVSSWLYKVAYRVALRVRARTAKRSAQETTAGELPARAEPDDLLWRDLRPVLDAEIDRLPEKYRTAFVLCYLEGHTNEEAAAQLGCPKGTILSRLARGRERLRSRLTRRAGWRLSAAWVATTLSQNAAAAVPAALVSSTIGPAILFAAGKAAAGLVSASVATLTEGVLHTMLLTKVKIATAALLTLAVLGTGGSIVSYRTLAGTPDPVRMPDAGARAEKRVPETEPQEYAAAAEEARGEREVRKAPDAQGRITAISDDGKTLTIEGGGRRGEEPTKFTVKLTDKTKVEWAALLQDLGYKLKVGDSAEILFQDGSKDTAAVIRAHRGADVNSRIVAVSADGKTLTLETPGPGRGEVTKVEIKLTDKTKIGSGGRGEAEAKPLTGYLASIWLQEGSKDTAAAAQISRRRPEVAGTISAISADGKVVTVESRNRGGDATTTEVKITDKTKIEYVGADASDKKLKVGNVISAWHQEGSTDTAETVQVNLQRRGPDVTGTISAVAADGKSITLENRKRGEDTTTTTEIKLTGKTELEFAGTEKAEEKKLTIGYGAAVWLQEGSKDTAAVVRASKPGERRR